MLGPYLGLFEATFSYRLHEAKSALNTVVEVSRGPAPAPLNLASYDPGSCFVGPGRYF
jgi:hypothetical protein